MIDWKKLHNGSDIRGVGLDTPLAPVNLTDEAVEAIGGAFVGWLSATTGRAPHQLRIGIGMDSRLSSPRIATAVIKGATNCGATLFDCGLASTPAMFMTTVTPGFEYDGAIMITASHLPVNRNGLKFFLPQGGLESRDIVDVLNRAATYSSTQQQASGSVQSVDFMTTYAAGLVAMVRKVTGEQTPLAGLKIVVDVGNGAGGFYVDKVLQPLGADTSGSQFLEPDGRFPNHIPNPEDEEAMAFITKATLENHADMGIIYDTDVDRAGAVDATGREINKNRLIAMMAAILLEEAPTTIVTDSITSTGLAQFIKDHGGIHHRYKRGYKNVINEAIRLNAQGQDTQIAIETSGHGALKENYFLDDGAYLMTKLVIKLAQLRKQGKALIDLIDGLAEPVESGEYRMAIKEQDFKAYGNQLINELTAHAQRSGWQIAPDNHEGIRVNFGAGDGDGWFLLRLSLHDPIIPVNIESDSAGGVFLIGQKLRAFLQPYKGLDLSPLDVFA